METGEGNVSILRTRSVNTGRSCIAIITCQNLIGVRSYRGVVDIDCGAAVIIPGTFLVLLPYNDHIVSSSCLVPLCIDSCILCQLLGEIENRSCDLTVSLTGLIFCVPSIKRVSYTCRIRRSRRSLTNRHKLRFGICSTGQVLIETEPMTLLCICF